MSGLPPVEAMPVVVRGWPTPSPQPKRRSSSRKPPRPSPWSITFDCETTTDESQRLRFGTYQVRHRDRLVRAGIFYDPATITRDRDIALLRRAARSLPLGRLLTRDQFVTDELLTVGWRLGGRVIGFNLPFDLGCLAISETAARPRGGDYSMAGGFSLQLVDDKAWPRIQVKQTGARSCFIRFAQPRQRTPQARAGIAVNERRTTRGFFEDVATIAAALLGHTHTLESLTKDLGTETQKRASDKHGADLTADYVAYACADTQATWECHQVLSERFADLGLANTQVHQLHSEASIAKARLRQIGVAPWRQQQPRFPDADTAKFLETYYGGRTETRIRRSPVPVIVVDYTSQYPTISVLQGLWPLLIAQGITMRRRKPAPVMKLIDSIGPDELLNPGTWKRLNVIVQIQPDGDRLPTRAHYAPNGAANIALSYRSGGPPQWYCLADAIASKLATGRTPQIIDAYAIAPKDPQPDLVAHTITAGDIVETLDPYTGDLMVQLIEQRARLQHAYKNAEEAGDHALAAQLDAAQYATKITANSIYGCTIEMNTITHPDNVDITITKPDGDTYPCGVARIDQPGQYFHPAIGTLFTAGGRLLLALAMRLVHDAGGDYAFCDTDSLAIVATPNADLIPCNGGPRTTADGAEAIASVSHDTVNDICNRVNQLNPYRRDLIPHLLTVEHGDEEPVWCWSIAAKRYALYTQTETGGLSVVECKESALGHLRSPTNDRKQFYREFWTRLLAQELRLEAEPPAWLDQPAIGKLAVTTPAELRNFRNLNSQRTDNERVRAFSFLATAHPHPLAHTEHTSSSLIAPKDTPPAAPRWIDRANPDQPRAITTVDPVFVIPGQTPVQTFRDLLNRYAAHPESKGLTCDAGHCGPATTGLLSPRHIEATEHHRCGKEANRYTDSPDTWDPVTATPTEYPEPLCDYCRRPVGHRHGRRYCNDACRKRHARALRSLKTP